MSKKKSVKKMTVSKGVEKKNLDEFDVTDGKERGMEEIKEEKHIFKAWHVDIIVAELGHGERTVQQFRLPRPNNIDAKTMEYHAIIEVLATLTQGALITWYEVAKMLATDKEMQKTIIHEATKGPIITDK